MRTDDIIKILEQTTVIGFQRSLAAGHMEPAPAMLQTDTFNIIVARLRAADELASAIKHTLKISKNVKEALRSYEDSGS